MKFDSKSVYKPKLTGSISLDLGALEAGGAGPWALGLIALALRDLVEGDICLGFGAAKGYGALKASVETVGLPAWQRIPQAFRQGLHEEGLAQILTSSLLEEESSLRRALTLWVNDLGQYLQS